jgi:hypothetical protein
MLTHHVFRYNTEFVEQVPGESRFARVHMTQHDHTELRLVFVLHNYITIIVQLLSLLCGCGTAPEINFLCAKGGCCQEISAYFISPRNRSDTQGG